MSFNNPNAGKRLGSGLDHQWGVYENLPPKRTGIPPHLIDQPSNEFRSSGGMGSTNNGWNSNSSNIINSSIRSNNNSNCTASMSGGVCRNSRAKSEKRELVDSWFSKSFAEAGGLRSNQSKSGNGADYDESLNNNRVFGGDGISSSNFEASSNIGKGDGRDSYTDCRKHKLSSLGNENIMHPGYVSGGGTNSSSTAPSSSPHLVSSGRVPVSMSTSISLKSRGESPGISGRSSMSTGTGLGSGSSRKAVPYRGSKTTSNVISSSGSFEKDGEDWDFLATLNDILRQEDFIGEAYSSKVSSNKNNIEIEEQKSTEKSEKSYSRNANNEIRFNDDDGLVNLDCNGKVVNPGNFKSNNNAGNFNGNSNAGNLPLSPRPPRPARRAEMRRKEYSKARSMDAGQLSSHCNDFLGMESSGIGTTPSGSSMSMNIIGNCNAPVQPGMSNQSQVRGVSPYQNVPTNNLSMSGNVGPLPSHPGTMMPIVMPYSSPTTNSNSCNVQHLTSRPVTPIPSGHRPYDPSSGMNVNGGLMRPQNSPLLMNTMSSSLDSIYDRLKSTDYVDPRTTSPSARPLTQVYTGGGMGTPYGSGYTVMNPYYLNQGGLGYGNGSYFGGGSGSNPNVFGSGNRLHHGNVTAASGSGYFYHPEFGYVDFENGNGANGYNPQRSRADNNNDPRHGGVGGNSCGSMNNVQSGSLPRLWNMPEGRSRSFGSLKGSLLGLDYEDRLLRLESDKETLHLQVSCLSDQIEAQTDKIKDLEKLLDDKRDVLENTEDQLNHELLTRSSLETQKLELLTEISSLRLKHASLERENVELKDRYSGNGKSTGDLSYFDGGGRIWDKPPLVPINGSMRSNSPAQPLLQDSRMRLGSNGSEHGQQQPAPPNRVRTPPANAYRRVDQSAFGTVPRRSPHSSQLSAFNGQLSSEPGGGGIQANKSGKSNSLSSGNINAIVNFNNGSSGYDDHQNEENELQKFHSVSSVPVHVPSLSLSLPRHSSVRNQNQHAQKLQLHKNHYPQNIAGQVFAKQNNTFYPSGQHPSGFCASPVAILGVGGGGSYHSVASSGDVGVGENYTGTGAGTTAFGFGCRRNIVPQQPSCANNTVNTLPPNVTFSSNTNPGSGSRSTSTPNLAGVEKPGWENKSSGNLGTTTNGNGTTSGKPKQSPSGGGGHKSRGILRILGKLRRSNSGGLDNDQIAPEGPGPFARGGLRATAQPRLGWVKEPSPLKKPEGPITSWDSEAVIMWLNYLGLGVYAGDVKRWVKTGQQLLDASPHELEKELGVKNHLHRKKLILALNAFKKPEEEDNAGKLDHHWVIRWLDDVGLPQYKETFGEARVDGRVLSYLTPEDLVTLKVTSMLHHVSIKRGVQLLRIHKFHPDCLCRRGGPTPGFMSRGRDQSVGNNNGSNGSGDYGSSDGSSAGGLWGPKQVATWTNHRVMEWLKAIDLAEYAPNLRGSGVHGALLIFESRFNAELMSTLLSIPGNKTLLRRHLSLQINEVVGKHIVQEKRTAELAPEFIPINPTTKVKATKRSQFPLRKKRLSTDLGEDLLCPVDLCVYPFHADSVGQLSSLENSIEGNLGSGGVGDGDKVSNI